MAVAGKSLVFLDTSVLVTGLIDLGPAHEHARVVMDRLASGALGPAATAWHCCLEFFAVSTRLPAEFRLTTADAVTLLEIEIFDRVTVADLLPAARREMLRQTVADQVFGGRVYDAHIAHVALEVGASVVLTDNRRHFLASLRHGVRVQTPAEFLASRR